jgi:hypothetical protein
MTCLGLLKRRVVSLIILRGKGSSVIVGWLSRGRKGGRRWIIRRCRSWRGIRLIRQWGGMLMLSLT